MVPVVKLWVRVMVPSMMPFPFLVEVMVSVFEPVDIEPVVMFTTLAEIWLASVTTDDASLFIVNVLNVVAPLTAAFKVPVICTVLVPGVKVPLLYQLPRSVCINEPAANVVDEPIVR